MKGAQSVLDSGRIRGATFELFVNKKPLKQRRPYLVMELHAFEAIAMHSKCPYDRYFAHFVLLQTYARARYNDIARETNIIYDLLEDDSGYLEIPVLNAKTQRSAEARTTFLPTVAPAVGVSQFRWVRSFINERKNQGIEDYCIMPTPAIQGGWHDSPLEISAANKWLKDMLAAAGFTQNLDLIGTHSGKVTGLSWCSKFGADLQTRSLLGYHLLKEFNSTLTYSRDALSEPLRVFDAILKAIRTKAFLPDMTRSGRKVVQSIKRPRQERGSAATDPPLKEDGYEVPEHLHLEDLAAPIEATTMDDELGPTSNSDESSSESDDSPESTIM